MLSGRFSLFQGSVSGIKYKERKKVVFE